MHILRIISSLDPRNGGPVEGARRIDAQLARLGHSIEVVCLDPPGQPFLIDYPATTHPLGPTKFGYRYCADLVPWLRENRNRFDVVIVNGLWQYHSFGAWRALAGTDTPYLVFTHGMLDPWFKHTYPLKHLKKWLYWPWAEYRVLRDAQAVLFTSEEERRLARDSFWLYRANEVVAAYGTDQPPKDTDGKLAAGFRTAHPELMGKRVLLFLSRIHEKKGCDLLVRGFAQVARNHGDLHLVIAGPDQTGWTNELKQLALALGVSNRITWPGMLQGERKWGAFHACEVFCLPSHQENFGIVVAEALGCRKPVLISKQVNIWREIEVDGAGIVRDDTLEGTVDGLTTWLNIQDEAKERMYENAQRCFDARFRIEQVADRLIRILSMNLNIRPSKHGLGTTP